MSNLAEQIETLSNRWMQAWIDLDREVIGSILAPDFALVVSAAPDRLMDRETWLRTCSDYRCSSFLYRDVQVRDLGSVAVMSSVAVQQASLNGVDRSGSFWLTDVWRPAGPFGWQVCARYSSHPEADGASSAALQDLNRRLDV
jgi:Domain of unknown function (DUF4440)